MFYSLEDDKPVILLLSEPGLLIPNLILEFFKSSSLDAELINLDQDFFLKYEQIAKRKKRIYKIIFIYGFKSNSREIYERTFEFFDLLSENQKEKIPLVLISSISSSLEILEDFNSSYLNFLKNQQSFLENFSSRFKESLIFLGQDILLDSKKIDYPLLLFFSAVKQNYLFDLQNKLYLQDEVSFFDLIKEYLIKPHNQAKFIIKGRAISSDWLVKKISYLYEQYFQKKLAVVKLIATEQKQPLFQEFSFVNNAKSQIEKLIDQKIRGLIDHDEELDSIAPTELELKKALEISRLQRIRQNKKNKVQKKLQKAEVDNAWELIKETDKEPTEGHESQAFDSELGNRIEEIFSTQRGFDKSKRQEENIVQGKKIIKKSKKRKFLFWLGSIGFSLSFIFLLLFSLFNLSQKTLQNQLYNVIKNGGNNIEKIDKSVIYGLFKFQLAQYQKVSSEESLSEALDIKKLADVLSALSETQLKYEESSYDLYKKTLDGGVKLEQSYEDLTNSIDKKIVAQKEFNAYLMALNLDLYQGEEKKVWQNILEGNKAALRDSIQVQRFLTPFKEFILQEGRVNVLVLFQDSNELRSTGGFLTELAILSFENASLIDKQILDVNDLDMRTYGHKDSSQEIKDLLGENILYLRDSNWQVDFSKSSQEIKWFAEQVSGSQVDLVLAINSKTIIKLLDSLSGVELANNVSVNGANYLENQEKTASSDYKSISDKKFNWQFVSALFEKVFSLNKEQLMLFEKVAISQLGEREILIQSADQNLQKAIEANSWSGKKVELVCPAEFKQDNCLLDFIFQVENNVGINKVNPYIKETIEHNLGISEQFIRHKRKITFENLAKSDTWPLGTYRDYLKFYLNSQASLEKIEINGQKIDGSRIKIIDGEDGREIAILLEIPKESKLEFTIIYLVPNQVKAPFSYVFFDQKQAGLFDKKTSYNIVFDEKFKPQLIAPQASYQDKVIHFNNANLDHFLFAINFSE
ncbi:MAG: hypothetical protein UT13_C0001G0039 [Candidatus Pacebacteria bacterium GW2011_GWF2_38_9]|nr:MAG: hypothetical protein US01_C0001G0039 [candidate division TM6 bacterium GW2011_GWF2_28_16]KKQ07781.1 MAG: hypothetical protein US20_C0030G0004 [Candidatus Pacebacteria bacterium GW2011_GWF1_36_5]KKQ88393.1 MAG: hypothetical protein UT13_C0001G0039 [Candidatus Pacebacteria bacterium GW2011_GWF2_38_9]HAZ73010.1 hypothetical protein [Candidatus Paceibacterota bacterium]